MQKGLHRLGWIAVGGAFVGAGALACDDALEGTDGPSPARLSVALNEDTPGSVLYTARVLVSAPAAGEYVEIAVPPGASISFAGASPSTAVCATARAEQAFQVTSTPATPSLTVVLGTWLATDGGPTLGPSSPCATSPLFQVEESIIQSVPATAAPAQDAALTDVLVADSTPVDDGAVDEAPSPDGGPPEAAVDDGASPVDALDVADSSEGGDQ